MAIAARYLADFHCRGGDAYTNPKERAKHRGHTDARTCFLSTWTEAPMRWVKRVQPQPQARYLSPLGVRCWHLVIGIRIDTGEAQTDCNVGTGRGPFIWRETPTLNWRDEPRERFCRRCVAAWTKEVASVTVRMDPVKLKKGQLAQLLEKVGGTDLMEIELRPTSVEDKPALVASWQEGSGRNETTEVRYLLIGDGLVKL